MYLPSPAAVSTYISTFSTSTSYSQYHNIHNLNSEVRSAQPRGLSDSNSRSDAPPFCSIVICSLKPHGLWSTCRSYYITVNSLNLFILDLGERLSNKEAFLWNIYSPTATWSCDRFWCRAALRVGGWRAWCPARGTGSRGPRRCPAPCGGRPGSGPGRGRRQHTASPPALESDHTSS